MEKEERTEIQGQLDFGKDAFYANGLAVSHSKNNFFLEFRQVLTRYSEGGAAVVPIKHSLVMIDKDFLKILIKILEENLKLYEDKFGKLEEPKFEKKKKIAPNIQEKTPTSYIG